MNTISRVLRARLRRVWDRALSSSHPGNRRLGGASPWTVRADLIQRGSTVISGGVGKDISFELQLVRQFECRIHLFDPSPTGIATMALPENTHPLIHFYPVGLAGENGSHEFARPLNDGEGSFRVASGSSSDDNIAFRCVKISDFVKQQSIDDITILKLDIEGFEYSVLNDVVSKSIPCRQICVEFHHFLPGHSLRDTLTAAFRLRRHGMAMQHQEMCDYLFVNKKLARNE